MGNEAEKIICIRIRKERVSREDRDIICVMGRKVRRAPWEKLIAGHIDLYNQSPCSYRNPIFINKISEASFRLSALAEITKDESLANLFAFVADELQEEKPSIARKLLIRFAEIALNRAKGNTPQVWPAQRAA